MRNVVILLVCIVAAASCSGGGQAGGRQVITVTIDPLRCFTEAIAGDRFDVVSMVPAGTSPETYDPAPQQLLALSKSAAYFMAGYLGFEVNWSGRLKDNCPGVPFFDTSEGISLIVSQEEGHEGHRHAGGVEPHVWNSTANAARIADNICRALCRIDGGHAEEYVSRADSLKRVISLTDSEIRSLLAGRGKSFLIYHPALSYFARDYGLHQISIEEEGKEPSPSALQRLIRQCREQGVEVIFVQQEFDVRNAQLIADELGVEVIPINPLSYEWREEMIGVARALAK